VKLSVSFRLTVAYAVLFALTSFAGLFATYYMIASHLMGEIDEEMREQASEIRALANEGGLAAVTAEFAEEEAAEGADNRLYRLLSADGTVLESTDASPWPHVSVSASTLSTALSGEDVLETQVVGPSAKRARIVFARIGPEVMLLAGLSLARNDETLSKLRSTMFAVTVAMMLLGSLVGWVMGKRAMAGVREVTAAADSITQGRYDERVRTRARGEEIDHLARAFNSMAVHVETLMRELREVNENIAHELRTPLTRMRGAAEMSLTTGDATEEQQALAGNVVEECDFLLGVIEKMLSIAELESGLKKVSLDEVDLTELVRDAVELFKPVAEDSDATLTLESSEERLTTLGEASLLQRMVSNLVDNALKHTPSGGSVRVSLRRDGGQANVCVSDTGEGISARDLPHIFDRFYRGDDSTGQRGSGLGLSVARTIARVHGGDIVVESSPGEGATFTVVLPANGPRPATA